MITLTLIGDDRSVLRDALPALNAEPDLRVIGTAVTLRHAESVSILNPNVLVIDLDLPEARDVASLSHLRRIAPGSTMLGVSTDDDYELIYSAIISGVVGFIQKHQCPSRLAPAIREVHNGESPMSGAITRMVLNSLRTYAPPVLPHGPLSKREQEVLSILMTGASYQDIASKLFLSTETIRTHVRNIYRKLHVRSWTEIQH